jgi:hypothetical protein
MFEEKLITELLDRYVYIVQKAAKSIGSDLLKIAKLVDPEGNEKVS